VPKKSKHPKLRVSVKRGRAGQVWTSYWYDMRGTGQPDIALGTDHAQALRKWAELYLDAPRMAGTLEEAFKAWERGALPAYTNADTRRNYGNCLRAMRPVFGRARWEEITLPILKQYVDKRSAKTRARHEMQLLSVIWSWARLQGLTDRPWPAVGMQRSGWKGKAGVRQIEVQDAPLAAIYKHADQCLRDAIDIATATGLRVYDVLALRLSDVRDGRLVVDAGKTGKRAEFPLAGSVLSEIVERRRAMRGCEHVFLLAAGRRPVTYRRLSDRFTAARAKAAAECPAAADLWLRDMRKRAAQQSESLQAASTLLQHSSTSTTRQHYRQGEIIKPLR
jgi:integrase